MITLENITPKTIPVSDGTNYHHPSQGEEVLLSGKYFKHSCYPSCNWMAPHHKNVVKKNIYTLKYIQTLIF